MGTSLRETSRKLIQYGDGNILERYFKDINPFNPVFRGNMECIFIRSTQITILASKGRNFPKTRHNQTTNKSLSSQSWFNNTNAKLKEHNVHINYEMNF